MALHQGCIHFSKIRSHLKILGTRKVTRSEFLAGDPQILDVTIKIYCHHDSWCLGFVHLHHTCPLTFTSSENRLSSFLRPVHGFCRLFITGVLADRKPVDLHLFRNYQSPSSMLGLRQLGMFKPTFDPEEQLVWRAARATGAAPTYFR
jgi:hypothetical protein